MSVSSVAMSALASPPPPAPAQAGDSRGVERKPADESTLRRGIITDEGEPIPESDYSEEEEELGPEEESLPEGFTVIVRPVNLPPPQRMLLALQGFLDGGASEGAGASAVPRLAPDRIALLESYVDMGADLLGGLVRAAAAGIPEEVREEAWRDLLGSPTIVGVSAASRSLREALRAAATSREPLFIEGEAGSGRRMPAAAVHRLGPLGDAAHPRPPDSN